MADATTTPPEPRRPLAFGEALPLLHAATNRNEQFALGALGGRFVLFCAIQDIESESAKVALAAIPRDPRHETHHLLAIFSAGQSNAALEALAVNRLVFNDTKIAAACGLFDPREPDGRWLLLDPTLRVLVSWPLAEAEAALRTFAGAPPPDRHLGAGQAPVLIAPNVFEPSFCRRLIEYYGEQGAAPSGITQQDTSGRTFVSLDDSFKRRSDCLIEDEQLREATMQRIYWRLAPMIERAFMWRPTRMERYLVARYDAESGGFFKPHRDNTTHGTAHRRFAVTINLNADQYEGGDLRFPEFGSRTYRAPTGGAVVFACAMLHEATPVTKGQRYAFLPFLYDDAGAKVREANNQYLDEGLQQYRDE
ncbi:MAG: 2OG-Fe(II) oxygenase [Alphaproteobacteria bacterium]|nr:2OG-Fe(II) oxygenase [Alphaproteobacteria bacterium]